MKKNLQLFLTFFKIGAFTLGGGYAMLSMVEKAVVDQKKWIPNDEFWDMIAVVLWCVECAAMCETASSTPDTTLTAII